MPVTLTSDANGIVTPNINIRLKADSGGVLIPAYPQTVASNVLDLDTVIASAIAAAGHLTYSAVAELPTSGATNVIYLVPSEQSTEEHNIYDEYMWLQVGTSGGQATYDWEILGNTQMEISSKLDYIKPLTSGHLVKVASGGTAVQDAGVIIDGTITSTTAHVPNDAAVYNYVSAALNGTSDHIVAYSGGGKLKDTGKIMGGSTFLTPADDAEDKALAAVRIPNELSVRNFLGTAEAADLLQSADTTQRGVVYFADTLDIANMSYPSATAPSVDAVNSALASTQPRLTFNAPLVSGANNTISINMATTASSGAVVLTTTPSASGGVAATPALVSAALNGTSDHVVAYSAGGKLKDTGKVVGGATFAATPNASTLATEAGVSAYVSTYAPQPGPATSNSTGVVQIGSNIEVTAAGLISVPMAEIAGIGDKPGVVWLSDNVISGGSYATTQQAVYDHVSSTIANAVVPATSSILGIVRIGSNISLNSEAGEDALISVPNATSGSAGVARLYNVVNTSTNGAVTPAAVSSYVSTLAAGITAVSPLSDNITATGGTISISSATANQSGAVLIMSGGTFTNAVNKVATEGAVFSNCIFYSIV